MANLYGVANAPGNLVFGGTIGGGNVTCNAGVETNVIASNPIIASSQGFFFCQLTGVLMIVYGATPPTALTIGFRFGAGADFTSISLPSQALVANAWEAWPIAVFTASFQNTWFAPGAVINVSINPTAQSVFAMQGSYANFYLVRSPDQ